MDYLINFFLHSYIGGSIFIIIGLLFSWKNYKTRHSKGFWFIRGWASSLGFIVLGSLIIVFKLMGKL